MFMQILSSYVEKILDRNRFELHFYTAQDSGPYLLKEIHLVVTCEQILWLWVGNSAGSVTSKYLKIV
jgi:hypothetical protein